jgi:hypothetical protein
MAAVFERYALRPARSPQEWAAYHAIRRDAIFAALLPGQPYDEQDADEFVPDHCPHVLLRDDEVVGVVRIDLIGKKQAGLRLVAISNGEATAVSCSDLRKKPRMLSAEPRSSLTHIRRRWASISPTVIARANGATSDRCQRPSFGSESGRSNRALPRSPGGPASSSSVSLPSQAP